MSLHKNGTKSLTKLELMNILDNLNEWNFLENIKSVQDYKDFLMKPDFWANSWAISIIEYELNLKFIILNESNYPNNNNNILQCGDFNLENIDNLPFCKVCKLNSNQSILLQTPSDSGIGIMKSVFDSHNIDYSHLDQTYEKFFELYKTIDKKHNHYFEVIKTTNEIYNPEGYIILTYSGNHYRLVTYNDTKFFKNITDLPSKLLSLIKKKCKKSPLFKKIKGFNK